MSEKIEKDGTITLDVDLTNPGQFLACCGLLELASRVNPEALGYFGDGTFHVTGTPPNLFQLIIECDVRSIQDKKLRAVDINKLNGSEEEIKEEKSPPVFLGTPFNLLLNWWEDQRARAAKLITWSGGANVPSFFIARSKARGKSEKGSFSMRDHFSRQLKNGRRLLQCTESIPSPSPFNFDSRLSRNVALDLGFVPETGVFSFSPAVEVLSLIGLQRFRPKVEIPWMKNLYFPWNTPLPVAISAAVACGAVPILASVCYAFSIVRRDSAGKRRSSDPPNLKGIPMPDLIEKYDVLLKEDGPAAIIVKQWLKPVGDDVVFPPTYAAAENDADGGPRYNIDRFDTRSVCVIDSIPSQANRIEPAFAMIADGKLVPQISIVTEKGGETITLLEAGHRLADAVVRFSSIRNLVDEAFLSRKSGDSLPLAKIAPTSIVFGAWDSRASGVKIPRLINSIIRAFDVDQYTRRAQYVAALRDSEAAGVKEEKGDGKLSTIGMADVPAPKGLGGVQAHGGICRDASLNLCTLRDIKTPDKDQAKRLRRYILGLSLVALTWFDGKTLNLRQGCQLVAMPDKPMSRKLVYADGTESDFMITREDAIAYATAAAEAFGVDTQPMNVIFDPKLAKTALKKKEKKGDEKAGVNS